MRDGSILSVPRKRVAETTSQKHDTESVKTSRRTPENTLRGQQEMHCEYHWKPPQVIIVEPKKKTAKSRWAMNSYFPSPLKGSARTPSSYWTKRVREAEACGQQKGQGEGAVAGLCLIQKNYETHLRSSETGLIFTAVSRPVMKKLPVTTVPATDLNKLR